MKTLKDTIISLSGNVAQAGVGFLFTVLVARSLAPEGFGTLSALLALVGLLSSFGDLGLSGSLISFLPKVKNQKLFLSTALITQLITSTALAFIVILLLPARQTIIPNSTISQLILAALLIFVFVIENFILNLLRATHRFALATVVQVLDSSLKLLAAYIFISSGLIFLQYILLANLISSFVATAVGFSAQASAFSLQFSSHHFKSLLAFSKWLAVTQVLGVVSGRIDALLLVSMSSAYAAGIFASVSRVTLLFTMFISSLSLVTAPRFASFTNLDQTKNYIFKILALILPIAAGMLLMIPFSKILVVGIFGLSYFQAASVLPGLILATLPPLFTLLTVGPLIYFFHQTRFVAMSTLVQSLLIVILDITLIPRYGAYAPSISWGIAGLVFLLMTSTKLCQKLSHTQS